MRCCAPFCRNTTDNVSTKEVKGEIISFYGFPSEVNLRASWLRALGKQDAHLPNSAVICSQHFLNDEMYETESGLKQICAGAIPSTIQVCMICLDTNSKLFLMSKHKFKEAYEKLTGYPLFDPGNLRQTVCILCAQRLRNFERFRAQSLKARTLVMDLVNKHEIVTKRHIVKINSANNRLKCNFVRTTLGPDHCDSFIAETDENKQTLTEKTIRSDNGIIIMNKDGNDKCVAVDQEMKDEYKDDNLASNINIGFYAPKEKYSISDDSITLEAKLLDNDILKALCQKKSAALSTVVAETAVGLQIPVKVESEQHIDNQYIMNMHLRNDDDDSDDDDEYGTLQICSPPPSPACDSTHMTENKQDIHSRVDDSSAELPHTVVSSTSMRLATNSGRKLHATPETDFTQKSLRDLENKYSQSYNQSYESNTKMNTHTNCVTDVDLNTDAPKDSSKNTNVELKDATEVSMRTLPGKKPSNRGTSKRNLKRKTTDPDSKPFACAFCDYKCKEKYNLKLHVRMHTGEKPFSCRFCDYRCARSGVLMVHVRRHTGEKPYTCKLCEKKFTDFSNLTSHMRTHSGWKPVSCTLCEYRCVDNGRLLSHMKTHTREKPYSCKVCQYRCSHKNHLVLHMRIHTGEKPYDCNLCEYKSARQSDLVKHMRTHKSVSTFCCKLCPFQCLTYRYFLTHMKNKH